MRVGRDEGDASWEGWRRRELGGMEETRVGMEEMRVTCENLLRTQKVNRENSSATVATVAPQVELVHFCPLLVAAPSHQMLTVPTPLPRPCPHALTFVESP